MIDTISQHIATLLRRNDCVIIPGVGAFVATRRSATLANDMLTPPRREVSFNPAMVHDDGLLAASVSRRMKISFEQARERVSAEAALMQRRLKAEGAVNIARVGVLQRRSGGRLEFVPAIAWTPALPAIRAAVAVPAFEVVRQTAGTAKADKAVAVVRVPLRLKWLRAAAAAAVLCVLGFALSTPIDINTAQHASLAIPAFTPPEESPVEPVAIPDNLELNLALAPADGAISTAKSEPATTAYTRQPYVIVIGSLPSRAKALEFINETGIASLRVMQSGDKFRVYAAEGDTPESARAAADNISGFSSRFPDAWVCRR